MGDGRFLVCLLLERSHIAPRRFEHKPITIGMLKGAICEAIWEMVSTLPRGAVLRISRFEELHSCITQV